MEHDLVIITSKNRVRRSRIRFTREQVIKAWNRAVINYKVSKGIK